MTPSNTAIRKACHNIAVRDGSMYQDMVNWLREHSTETLSYSDCDGMLHDALPKESHYQKKILDWLHKEFPKAFVWKAAAGPYSRQGIPDICAVIEGRLFAFEIKRPFIGRISAIQAETIRAIRIAGGIAEVVSFPEQCEKIIRSANRKR